MLIRIGKEAAALQERFRDREVFSIADQAAAALLTSSDTANNLQDYNISAATRLFKPPFRTTTH